VLACKELDRSSKDQQGITRDMVSVMWKILAGTVWSACASKHNPGVPGRDQVLSTEVFNTAIIRCFPAAGIGFLPPCIRYGTDYGATCETVPQGRYPMRAEKLDLARGRC
jgi:hypothetical protein